MQFAEVRALVTGDPEQAETAQTEAAEAIAAQRNIPIEEAESQVAQYEQQYRERAAQAGEQVTEVADTLRIQWPPRRSSVRSAC